MKEEYTFEDYIEATDTFNRFVKNMGGNPAFLELEDIKRDISGWPEYVQKAWKIMNEWGDSEEIY